MEEGSYVWIFGTISQVLGAMIAVLAVFVVYALDAIQRSIEWSRDDLVRIVKPLGLGLESFGLDGQLDQVKAKIDLLRHKDPREPRLRDLEQSWMVIVDRRARRVAVTRSFHRLLGYSMVVIGTCTTALPFANWLEHQAVAGPVAVSAALLALLGALGAVYVFLSDSLRLLVLTNPEDSVFVKAPEK